MSDSEKMMSLADSTYRLRWEITKEQFESCDFLDMIRSPTYAIDINGEETKWYMSMRPKGFQEQRRNEVFLSLKKVNDVKIYKVRYQFGIETKDGYWPEDALKKMYLRKSIGRIDSFGTDKDAKVHGWGYSLCSSEEFQNYFVDNKVTVVACFVIYVEGEKHIKDMEVAEDFVAKMRSISSFESFSDFTVISGNTRFPCHRVILAATSKYFEALFRNEPSKKETEMEEPPEVVLAMLHFMYKGLIPEDIDVKAMDLILMSDKYDLDLLTKACEMSLVDNLSPENAVETLITIDKIKHVSKKEHRNKVLVFIKTEVDRIAKTQDWNKFLQSYPELITELIGLK